MIGIVSPMELRPIAFVILQEGSANELSLALNFLKGSLGLSHISIVWSPFEPGLLEIAGLLANDIRISYRHLRDVLSNVVDGNLLDSILRLVLTNEADIPQTIETETAAYEFVRKAFGERPPSFWNVGADLELHRVLDPLVTELRSAMICEDHDGRAFAQRLKQIEVQFRSFAVGSGDEFFPGKVVDDVFVI
jgi:hypothetical protein